MKNKEVLLKLSYLCETWAKVCMTLGIIFSIILLLGNLILFEEYKQGQIYSGIVGGGIVFTIGRVFNIILNSINAMIKSVLDIAEDVEKMNNKGSTGYFTTNA